MTQHTPVTKYHEHMFALNDVLLADDLRECEHIHNSIVHKLSTEHMFDTNELQCIHGRARVISVAITAQH